MFFKEVLQKPSLSLSYLFWPEEKKREKTNVKKGRDKSIIENQASLLHHNKDIKIKQNISKPRVRQKTYTCHKGAVKIGSLFHLG